MIQFNSISFGSFALTISSMNKAEYNNQSEEKEKKMKGENPEINPKLKSPIKRNLLMQRFIP